MIKTPRDYLSYSQKILFNRSPGLYYEVYFLGRELPTNRFMRLGSEFADMMEKDKAVRNPIWELIRNIAPDEPKREYEVVSQVEGINLLSRFDRFNPFSDPKRLREQKTGKKWTQGMADRSEQLTFYAYNCYLKYKVIPSLFLDWFRTDVDENGQLYLTGEMVTFETKRTVRDFLLYHGEIEKTWAGIQELCREEELITV